MNMILLSVILLEVGWFEILRVLCISKDVAEDCIAISVVGEASLAPSVDNVPSIDS